MGKYIDVCVDKPAIFGGEPLFKEKVSIIKPTLFDHTEIDSEMQEIFSTGNVTVSKYVRQFEKECAQYFGVRQVVAVANATTGLMLAVKGLGLSGEVIVPSFTFTATVHSLVWNNITPVFVDCEEGTYNIDVSKVKEKITAKTSAIMPVYIFGNPPRIKELEEIAKRNNLKLIFDSAQAFGAEYKGIKAGGFGDCEIFSLSPTKVLTAIEGGLIATNDEELAGFLRQVRDYGKTIDGKNIEFVGLNARMSELHALVGLKNLKNIEKCLKTRRELIALYKAFLGGIDGLSFQEVLLENTASGNYMVIFVDKKLFGISRDDLCEALKAENIETKKYFHPPIHMQKAYFELRAKYAERLPVTEKASERGLALPLYGHMDTETAEKVCCAIRRICFYSRQMQTSTCDTKVNVSTANTLNKHQRGWKENLVLVVDLFTFIFCYATAYFLRFDGVPPERYLDMMLQTLPLILTIRLAALYYFKLHKCMWRYASIKDLTQILKATTLSSIFITALAMALYAGAGYPRSIFVIDWLLLTIALSGTRFIIRLSRPFRWRGRRTNGRRKKILIVGASDAAEMILREIIYQHKHNYEVVGLVDDNPEKYKRRIHGVMVLGTTSDIPDIVDRKNVEEIIIAAPTLKPDQMRDVVSCCVKSGAKYRTIPDISNVVNGRIKVKELREIKFEDFLKRDEVILNTHQIAGYIKGKRVLITGAGGSIGSELCRQLGRLSIAELVLFEKAENALFYIDLELGQLFKKVNKVAVVGDICDRARVKEIFERYKPEIIFHAAAHKHVPLMETNSMEAIKNNVFGTKVIVEEAIKSGVERFIMLSTDKAVEPTSLMGVSKKVSEMYLSNIARTNGTKFMAVRFGNVIGSEGSVVPTFKKQIEKGGPVTITHPEIKRYFMTIPEAAGLVLEAGFMGEGGEIFILEMGRQIKILDLAKSLIELSGLNPDKDIEIKFTGLRPGEKMYEALFAVDEKLIKTANEKLFIVQPKEKVNRDIFEDIKALEDIVWEGNMPGLLNKLKEIVPEYRPSTQVLNMPEKRKVRTKNIDILIVDDDEVVRDLLHKFLEGRGYNTLLAANGKEALERIEKNDVSVAIVDIKMPGFIDGLKVLKQIKRKNKNIGVIHITGFATEKSKKISAHLGAHAYLEKPFDLLDIKRNIEDVLRKDSNSRIKESEKQTLQHEIIGLHETSS